MYPEEVEKTLNEVITSISNNKQTAAKIEKHMDKLNQAAPYVHKQVYIGLREQLRFRFLDRLVQECKKHFTNQPFIQSAKNRLIKHNLYHDGFRSHCYEIESLLARHV